MKGPLSAFQRAFPYDISPSLNCGYFVVEVQLGFFEFIFFKQFPGHGGGSVPAGNIQYAFPTPIPCTGAAAATRLRKYSPHRPAFSSVV